MLVKIKRFFAIREYDREVRFILARDTVYTMRPEVTSNDLMKLHSRIERKYNVKLFPYSD